MPVIQLFGTWRLGRSRFKASPGKTVSKTSTSTNKLGMVVHTYNPSYIGGIDRRITV
jgi:hypothetical protein